MLFFTYKAHLFTLPGTWNRIFIDRSNCKFSSNIICVLITWLKGIGHIDPSGKLHPSMLFYLWQLLCCWLQEPSIIPDSVTPPLQLSSLRLSVEVLSVCLPNGSHHLFSGHPLFCCSLKSCLYACLTGHTTSSVVISSAVRWSLVFTLA